MGKFKAYMVFMLAALIMIMTATSAFAAAVTPEEFIDICQTGTIREIQAAIKAGADVNGKYNNGRTALMFAAENNNPEVTSLLLKAGADADARDNEGWTAIIHAARQSPEVVSALVKGGADVNARDNSGWTALMYAVEDSEYAGIVSVLVEAGADVNAKNDGGGTVFDFALSGDNAGVFPILVKAGAKDKNGRTALDLARENKNPDVASALEKVSEDLSAWFLKNGVIYKDEDRLDFEVHETVAETAGTTLYWSVIDPEEANGVPVETGVYFFSEDGACIGIVPLESVMDAQDVALSPDGRTFVLTGGSGMRPDVFFTVYALEGPTKKAELNGLRDQLEWFDENRFVYTKIESNGIREGGSFPGFSYGLKLSAAVYDVGEGEEIVLKEATNTQNFYYSSLTETGVDFELTEEYVEFPEDWGDEGKIRSRKIRVPIPLPGP
jgi:ankyrin repeat protein